MKLHDLRPAAGSRKNRTRVGRGIAAGKGKTAGRGTKGQKARAGGTIPAWFEGGQTPIHIRVPKLRGFKNRFKIEFIVVNVGVISEYAEAGRFGVELEAGAKPARGKAAEKGDSPVTVNAEVLASAGLIGSTEKPLKVLGQGDVSQKLFVAADAFSASARRKIEEAGGFVQVLAPEKVAKTAPVSTAERRAARRCSRKRTETTTSSEPVAEATAAPATEASEKRNAKAPAEPRRRIKRRARRRSKRRHLRRGDDCRKPTSQAANAEVEQPTTLQARRRSHGRPGSPALTSRQASRRQVSRRQTSRRGKAGAQAPGCQEGSLVQSDADSDESLRISHSDTDGLDHDNQLRDDGYVHAAVRHHVHSCSQAGYATGSAAPWPKPPNARSVSLT